MNTQKIELGEDTRVLVLTGAGVSAESGISTFRDAGGLWEQQRIEDVASPEGFARDPELVWRFYSLRREQGKTCAPNAGHVALADLARRLGDRFLLATQNVDGLHAKAGSARVVEMHGNLFMSRCTRCDRAPFPDDQSYRDRALPLCEHCRARGERALLRPHIVWFGEMLDPEHMSAIDAFMRSASRGRFVFLAAGTSGVVYPAAGLVDAARRFGASTWLVNLEPPENASRFEHFVRGKSGDVLPNLFG